MKNYILLLFIFFVSNSSFAVEWHGQNDGLEVDYHSVDKSRTSVTARVKDYNKGQYDRRNMRKVSYVVYRHTAFCTENKIKKMSASYYDRKGRLIDIEQYQNIHYLRVDPTSFENKLFKAICAYF